MTSTTAKFLRTSPDRCFEKGLNPMRKKLSLLTAGLVIALAGMAGVATPALAETNTPNDQQNAPETDSAERGGGVCSSGWRYIPTSREADVMYAVGPGLQNDNGTTSPAQVTYTSTVGATFTATVDGSANVGISAKLASANLAFGTALQGSVTAEVGNSITVTVPPRATSYAQYVVWQVTVKGDEQQIVGIGPVCNVVDSRWSDMVAPFRYGWNTWELLWD